MAHAVLIRVKLDPSSRVEHRKAVLDKFVVPETMALRGFQRATWMNDGAGAGACLVVFDSAQDAESAKATLTPDGGPPIISCAIHEVEREA